MDDAGNHSVRLRAKPSSELFEVLRAAYNLEPTDDPRDLGGSSTLNLFFSTNSGQYVARVYQSYITRARLDATQLVRCRLVMGEVPCPEIIPTLDGETWTTLDNRLIEVERFVDHDNNMDSWERLEAGLPWLGRIHSLLEGFAVHPDGSQPIYANHVEPFDTLELTGRGTRRVRAWGPSTDELRLIEAIEELARRVTDAEQSMVPLLPRQLVHGDFWDNNVFFRDGRVVSVIDFDFMGERARIDDLALTLYYTNSTFSDDQVSDIRIGRLRRLVDAYNRGLENPLSGVERKAVPLALARQPLWGIGRWLPVLANEDEARQGLADMSRDVAWALKLTREIEKWQEAFALRGDMSGTPKGCF